MYVSGSNKSQAYQGVNTRDEEIVTIPQGETEHDFNSILSGILSPMGNNDISEEELFAGLIQERIQKLKGSEAAASYSQALSAERSASTGQRFSIEEAARGVLQQLEDDGTLTYDEATTIHAQAFKAAQLDGNSEALYDDKGGPNDPTIAIAKLEAALLSARTKIEEIEGGDSDPGTLTLDIGNTGLPNIRVKINDDGTFGLPSTDDKKDSGVTPVDGAVPIDGAEGFLFKPISDTTGNLVILLPQSLKNNVESVILKNSSGETLEEGIDSGYANGDRQHFRFNKPGAEFGANVTVEVKLKSGGKEIFMIEDPSRRHD
jgi:hypothetical protein